MLGEPREGTIGRWALKGSPPRLAADGSNRVPVIALKVAGGARAHLQVAEQAVGEAVDPAVDREVLSALPCIAHHGRLSGIEDLFDDVQFAD